MIEYKVIDEKNRGVVSRFLDSQWYGRSMVVEGEVVDLLSLEGMVALEGFTVEGVMTYRVEDDTLRIVTVDAKSHGHGIGTMLTTLAVEKAKALGLKKVVVLTRNDNIVGIEFYQKIGFDLKGVRRNSLNMARAIKENIPLMGKNGIPVRHEVLFEMEI